MDSLAVCKFHNTSLDVFLVWTRVDDHFVCAVRFCECGFLLARGRADDESTDRFENLRAAFKMLPENCAARAERESEAGEEGHGHYWWVVGQINRVINSPSMS